MSTQKLWDELKEEIAQEAVQKFRFSLCKNILVGPIDDSPNSDYTILFGEGECHIGRFATRFEACNVANIISDVIEQHIVRK